MQPFRVHVLTTFSVGAASFSLEVLVEVAGGEALGSVELAAGGWVGGGGRGLIISFGVGLIVWMIGLVVPVFDGDMNDGEDEIGFSAVA